MPDTKILQAILDKISLLEQKVDHGFKSVGKQFEEVNTRFDKIDKRLNNLGVELAQLSDDAPTLEEFETVKKRLPKLEKQIASA